MKKIPLICDENEEKFGRYTPGSNIRLFQKTYEKIESRLSFSIDLVI